MRVPDLTWVNGYVDGNLSSGGIKLFLDFIGTPEGRIYCVFRNAALQK